MEDTQQRQLNNYLTWIKNNKYSVYSIIGIAILFFLIIAMFIFTLNVTKKNSSPISKTTPQVNVSSVPSAVSTSPSVSIITIITPEPTQAAIIETQTQPQITPNVAVPYTVSDITQYGDNWATMNITNPGVGSAKVIIQKVNGTWKVVLGPGSFFSPNQLQSSGAPEELINSFTDEPSETISTSPSPSSSPGSF